MGLGPSPGGAMLVVVCCSLFRNRYHAGVTAGLRLQADIQGAFRC